MQPPAVNVGQVYGFVVFREEPVWTEVTGELVEAVGIEYAVNIDQE